MLHSRRRLRLLGRLHSSHAKERVGAVGSGHGRSAERARLSKEAIGTMDRADRRGYCNWLVDLHGRRIVLVRRLLVLLALTHLALAMLCFYLAPLFLLGGVLHDLSLPVLALTHFPFAVWDRLVRRWAVLLL
jgi:hypothetical protein